MDIEINSVQFDSRLVRKGDLFVATPGTVVNGHDYIPKAIAQGGVAVVCEQLPKDWDSEVTYVQLHDSLEGLGIIASAFYDNPSRKLTLVGVTGTNGKTTIATLLYKLTRALGYKAGLLSTVCNYVDDVAVEATHTTPDPLELNRLLGEMVDAGCDFLTSQMFFDNDAFYSFLCKIREAGIYVPVVAGIMPVTNAKQIKRMMSLSGSTLPARFRRIIDRFGSDAAAMTQAGIAYATEQIIDLYANGVKAVHVYSMNKPHVAAAIRANLKGIV